MYNIVMLYMNPKLIPGNFYEEMLTKACEYGQIDFVDFLKQIVGV